MSRSEFAQIMKQLYQIGSQLNQLQNAYSPDIVNYHHLRDMDQLKEQLQQAQSKIKEYQEQMGRVKNSQGESAKKLRRQNEELLTINEELVKSNDKFRQMFEKTRLEKEMMAAQLAQEQQIRKNLENKYNKEIQHLKLMHAQELYILKKKDKKG